MMNPIWFGVVESRMDPLQIGRCRVRIFGIHTEDVMLLPTDDLPWAIPIQPITSAANGGIGVTPLGPVEGTMVVGFFLDHPETQTPAFFGAIAGIPQDPTIFENVESLPQVNDIDVLRVDGEKSDLEPNYITSLDVTVQQAERLNLTIPTPGFPPLHGTSGGGGAGGGAAPDEGGAGGGGGGGAGSGGGGGGRTPYTSNSPHQMQVDAAGFKFIKENSKFSDKAVLKDGIWHIGYDEREIDGRPVTAGQKITEPEASKALHTRIVKKVEPYIRENVTADITQSMFNSLAAIAVKDYWKIF